MSDLEDVPVDLIVARKYVEEGRAKINLIEAIIKLELKEIDKILGEYNEERCGAYIRALLVARARWR